MDLKVMTYNIQGGCNNAKPPVKNYDFASYIVSEFAPDIVGLNEVGKQLPEGINSHAGYMGEKIGMNWFFAPAIDIAGYPYGNALLSKYPIINPHVVMIPDPLVKDENTYYETRCLLVADIDVGRGLTVIVSHFGLANSERVNAVKTVLNEIEKSTKPVILMGDFNMSPDDLIIQPLYENFGEVDKMCNANLNTFPSDAITSKIDYIFISKEFKVDMLFVPVTLYSDHCPLVSKLKF